MNDFFGNMLEIGDVVAITPHDYKHLVQGTVVGFTPKMVKVSYMRRTWRPNEEPTIINRAPDEVVKKTVT
jgi:hypothetical protein